jgi:hypothetical protein
MHIPSPCGVMQRRFSAEASCVFHYVLGDCTRDPSGLKAPQGDAKLRCERKIPRDSRRDPALHVTNR